MKKPSKNFLIISLLGIISLISVSFLWEKIIILTTVLIVISILMLIKLKDKKNLYLYIFSGIAGTIAEGIGIFYEAWTYSFPSIAGIPLWLPLLWGIAALFIITVSKEIEQVLKN